MSNIWTYTKRLCRLFSAAVAVIFLAIFIGQALTGGVRIEATEAHAMNPWDALWALAWLISIVVTAITSASEA